MRNSLDRRADPIDRSSIATRIADHLRSRIAAGTLAPGERVLEVRLARELGVSRSPIREALAQLAVEGLVRLAPYRGAIVTPLDSQRFRELVAFRVALEEFAVRRAAQAADARDLERVAAAIAVLRVRAEQRDFEGTVVADLELHELLIALARNEPLQRAYTSLLNEFRLYIRLTSRHYASIDELADEHDLLARALRERRGDEAAGLIRRHIVHGFDAVLEELERA